MPRSNSRGGGDTGEVGDARSSCSPATRSEWRSVPSNAASAGSGAASGRTSGAGPAASPAFAGSPAGLGVGSGLAGPVTGGEIDVASVRAGGAGTSVRRAGRSQFNHFIAASSACSPKGIVLPDIASLGPSPATLRGGLQRFPTPVPFPLTIACPPPDNARRLRLQWMSGQPSSPPGVHSGGVRRLSAFESGAPDHRDRARPPRWGGVSGPSGPALQGVFQWLVAP